MNYKENMLIIAPANMHTAIYDDILINKGDCIHIEVQAMKSFIQHFFKGDIKEDLELLYQYKEQLSSLSRDNSFYDSRESYDFLKACLDFVKLLKTYQYNLCDLPTQSKKQEDLKEAIEQVYTIPTKEDSIPSFINQTYNFDSVYILRKEYKDIDYFWIDFLLKNGAHWLENNNTCEKNYWKTSNVKTQAQLVAETIIEKGYDAKDVFVAASEEIDNQLLAHFFDFYHIPYTFLQNDNVSNLQYQYISILNWAIHKDRSTLIEVVKSCFPRKEILLQYLQIFPEDVDLSMKYIENELIDKYDYQMYQKMQQTYFEFKEEYKGLMNLSFLDIEASLRILSGIHTHLSKEDYKIAGCIYELASQALPYMHTESDMYLFMDALEHMQSISGPAEYKGVLIGKRKDITPLRDIVFLVSAHNKQFPSLDLQTGLFDESYLKYTSLPSLQDRLNRQREQIFTCLCQCKELYVLYPQASFEGKSFVSSLEMNQFMECKDASFVSVKESSTYEKPSFELDKTYTEELFFKDNTFNGSISRLESYTKCPLQHYIRYGLRLKEKKEWNDIRIRGTILHHILEQLANRYDKQYATVSREQIEEIVEEEFEFAKKIFPHKNTWLNTSKMEYVSKIALILEQLAYFEKNWKMHIKEKEYKYDIILKDNSYSICLYGIIDRVDISNTSFCVFDYKTSDKDLSLADFEAGISLQLATYTIAYEKKNKLIPVGQFYISLKTTPLTQEAYKGNYRKKNPSAEEIQFEEDAYAKSNTMKGWAFQDIKIYEDIPSGKKKGVLSQKKDTPSFEDMKSNWEIIVRNIVSEIRQGSIEPSHIRESDSCKYCSYKPICRNARKEIEIQSRLHKEEN